LKCLYLTKYRVKIPHSAREATVKKALVAAEIDKKWAESSWGKRLAARKIRENLTDFDRFKLMRAKQAVIILFPFSFCLL
jgi:large subunit ribosomal protein L14e